MTAGVSRDNRFKVSISGGDKKCRPMFEIATIALGCDLSIEPHESKLSRPNPGTEWTTSSWRLYQRDGKDFKHMRYRNEIDFPFNMLRNFRQILLVFFRYNDGFNPPS